MPPVFSIPPEYRKREVLFLGGIEINHWYDCRRMFGYQVTLKISVVRKEQLWLSIHSTYYHDYYNYRDCKNYNFYYNYDDYLP